MADPTKKTRKGLFGRTITKGVDSRGTKYRTVERKKSDGSTMVKKVEKEGGRKEQVRVKRKTVTNTSPSGLTTVTNKNKAVVTGDGLKNRTVYKNTRNRSYQDGSLITDKKSSTTKKGMRKSRPSSWDMTY